MNLKDWFVIINPNAGKGLGQKHWKKVSNLLEDSGFQFSHQFTEHKGHAINLIQDQIFNGFEKYIVLGGDGTFNECVNGIKSQQFKSSDDIIITMIPIGTGNDWCRTFKIPNNYEKAVNTIKIGKIVQQDLGLVTFYNNGKETKRLFANIAGIGFDALVNLKSSIDKDKNRKSKILYFKNLLSSLITYKSVHHNIGYDDGNYQGKVFSLSVGKGKFNGGGMKQLPFAEPTDGFLDFTLIKDVSRLEVIGQLPKLFKGTHINHRKISTYKSKKIIITTEEPVFLEVDGESVGESPFTFEVVPESLKVICGL